MTKTKYKSQAFPRNRIDFNTSRAEDYLENGKGPNINDLIRVGLEAVRRSQSQDLYSHGLDMVVCTSEGINDHFTELGDDFGKKLKRIQRGYGK